MSVNNKADGALPSQNQELAKLYVEQAKQFYQQGKFSSALNDLNKALDADPTNSSASAMKLIVEQIISFKNMGAYDL